MIAVDDTGKSRHGFTLGTSAENADFAGLIASDHGVFDDGVVWNLDIAIFPGDADDVDHGTAEDADLTFVLNGDFDDLLDTVDVAGEGRDDDTARGFIEDVFNAASDGGFAWGIAFKLRVGGVG